MSGGGPVCPYCGHETDYPDEWPNGEEEIVQHECKCGKTFTYTVSWSPDFTEQKAPCLNEEGDHDWGECSTYGYPGGPHKSWMCKNCGEVKYDPAHPLSRESQAARCAQQAKGK